MAEKTIRVQFYNWVDEDGISHSASKGDTVDLPDKEVERGDGLGAFEDSEGDPVQGGFALGEAGPDLESGVETAPPPEVDEEAKQPQELAELDPDDVPDPTSEGYPKLAQGAEESSQAPSEAPAEAPAETPAPTTTRRSRTSAQATQTEE